MATYTTNDVNAALVQGLISNEDAQYLTGALEEAPPVGAMVGGGLGAAGSGITADIARTKYGLPTMKVLEELGQPVPTRAKGKLGRALNFGLGALAGGGLGAGLGSLVAPGSSGKGIQPIDSEQTGTPWGGLVGGTLGAAGGAMLTGKSNKFLVDQLKQAGIESSLLGKMGKSKLGKAANLGIGAITGGAIGAGLGSLVAPSAPNDAKNQALLALMDQNIPAKEKATIRRNVCSRYPDLPTRQIEQYSNPLS